MDRVRIIAIAAILLAAFLGVGYMSLSSSSYKSVSDLAGVDREVKVTVEGSIIPLGKGNYTLYVDGREFQVEALGSYGVARDSMGDEYAVFILGDDQFRVLAIYYVGDSYMTFQTGNALKSNVVVSASYMPNSTALLITPHGTIELPVLEVDSILKGCHESYGQEAATIG